MGHFPRLQFWIGNDQSLLRLEVKPPRQEFGGAPNDNFEFLEMNIESLQVNCSYLCHLEIPKSAAPTVDL